MPLVVEEVTASPLTFGQASGPVTIFRQPRNFPGARVDRTLVEAVRGASRGLQREEAYLHAPFSCWCRTRTARRTT